MMLELMVLCTMDVFYQITIAIKRTNGGTATIGHFHSYDCLKCHIKTRNSPLNLLDDILTHGLNANLLLVNELRPARAGHRTSAHHNNSEKAGWAESPCAW